MGQRMSHAMGQNCGPMPRKSPYYYPKISRFMVSVLYHEAQSLQMPMTELAGAPAAPKPRGLEELARGGGLAGAGG